MVGVLGGLSVLVRWLRSLFLRLISLVRCTIYRFCLRWRCNCDLCCGVVVCGRYCFVCGGSRIEVRLGFVRLVVCFCAVFCSG